MARAGRKDRGLLSKASVDGTILWYVRLYHEGREQRFGSFPTKTAAREYYEKAKAEQKLGRFFPERYQYGGSAKVQDVIDGYMATNTNKTAGQDKHYAGFWKDWFAGATLKAITPETIEKAKAHLSERTIGKEKERQRQTASQTVLHYLKFLRHVLNIAVRDGKLDKNPMAQVGLPKVHKGKLRFLSLEEENRLTKAMGPTYTPWVRFAILTGLRREEQFSLRWIDMDADRGVLTIPVTKAGGARYVHLNEEAKTILRGLDSWLRSPWVFPSQKPATHYDSDNFYRRIYLPAVQEAKLEGVTWHTLRHTFASRLAMAGATEQDIAACLGHTTTALVRRYAHLSPAHLQGVVEKVAAFGKPAISEGQDSQSSGATVTKTGKQESVAVGIGTQVVENVGAGDGI